MDIKYSKKGTLPRGLKLNKYTGEITGVPKKAGEYTFSIKAKNKGGTDLVEYTMTVAEESDSKASASAANVGVRASGYNVRVTELVMQNEAASGMPLTFRVGDHDDDEEVPDYSGLRVYIDDEEAEDVSVAPDGTFTLPAELVQGTFSVYAAGVSDGQELETAEIEVDAAYDAQDDLSDPQPDSSGSCSVNFMGMFMLAVSGAVLLRKK